MEIYKVTSKSGDYLIYKEGVIVRCKSNERAKEIAWEIATKASVSSSNDYTSPDAGVLSAEMLVDSTWPTNGDEEILEPHEAAQRWKSRKKNNGNN